MVSDQVHLSHTVSHCKQKRKLHCIVGFQKRAVVHWLLSVVGPLFYAYSKFTSTTHSKRSVSPARLLMSSLLGLMLVNHILYDVYFICSSSLPMDSVRYIANHDVLYFLPSETAFWRLAQNEHPSLVDRTWCETVTAKVHAEMNAELLKRSLRNPASAQRSRRSLIASLLRSSPRGP